LADNGGLLVVPGVVLHSRLLEDHDEEQVQVEEAVEVGGTS
jgi:hypothetical protein